LAATAGFCEALRGEIAISETLQSTDVENLSVVTAGQTDHAAIRFLGQPHVASLFRELGQMADYVIVDGPPILPVADAGFLCQHVDAVVFAVRRDVSQVPQVRAARSFMAACGVRVLGGVVTEGSDTLYSRSGYQVYDVS
jgi:Mrp family chromosome partitioning ATPase